MKKLYGLLFILVFIALIGMGWLIDNFYQSFESKNIHVFPQSEAILLSFRDHLDKSDNLDQITLPSLFQLESLEQFVLPDELNKQLLNGSIVFLNSEEGISLHIRLNEHRLVLSLGPLKLDRAEAPWLKYILTAVFYSSIALILLLWFKPLLMAVLQLSNALKNIAKGKLETRLKKQSLYLNVLFEDFNKMAQKLEILNENNKIFSQAVSHDIRTPLSRIMFALEKINDQKESVIEEVVYSITDDVKKIESLSKELLQYSRLEKNQQLENESIDVSLLIEQVILGFDHHQRHIQLNFNSLPQSLLIDADLLQKILNNLLSNGVRYSDTKIILSAVIENNRLEIIVEDDGKGIDFKNKSVNDFCQPFIQQKRSDKHFGLGLAIVNRAIKLMQGELKIDNQSSLGGARFIVKIPLLECS